MVGHRLLGMSFAFRDITAAMRISIGNRSLRCSQQRPLATRFDVNFGVDLVLRQWPYRYLAMPEVALTDATTR